MAIVEIADSRTKKVSKDPTARKDDKRKDSSSKSKKKKGRNHLQGSRKGKHGKGERR